MADTTPITITHSGSLTLPWPEDPEERERWEENGAPEHEHAHGLDADEHYAHGQGWIDPDWSYWSLDSEPAVIDVEPEEPASPLSRAYAIRDALPFGIADVDSLDYDTDGFTIYYADARENYRTGASLVPAAHVTCDEDTAEAFATILTTYERERRQRYAR